MPSKEEFYEKIISSLQSDITKINTELSGLKKKIGKIEGNQKAIVAPISAPNSDSLKFNKEELKKELLNYIDSKIVSQQKTMASNNGSVSLETLKKVKEYNEIIIQNLREEYERRFIRIENCAKHKPFISLTHIHKHFEDNKYKSTYNDDGFWVRWKNEILWTLLVFFLTAAFVMVCLLIDNSHLKTEINMLQDKIELINMNTNTQKTS